jgi:protein-L-isoaspartate(D-aspartate) O-methyltransferase
MFRISFVGLPFLVLRSQRIELPLLTFFGRYLAAPHLVLLACMMLFAESGPAQESRRWTEARQRMVREEVEEAGIDNARVCEAMRQTPRHEFVPESQRHLAYFDLALPIGAGQTISPPFIVAMMTQAIDPQPTEKVLEIGTGSGYQAAVLSPLAAEVYSIEIVESLGRTAAKTLRRLGYSNVHTKVGDGYLGWPEHAPFDKIIVTCSPEKIPQPLVDQLREGGRMVIPLGERYQQTLYRFKKTGGKLEAEALETTFFVPMTGQAEQLRQLKDSSGLPEVANGSFETTSPEGLLTPWYYVRQGEAVNDADAPDGERVLRFRNETPGRGAQALQAIAMDGRQVEEVEVSLWAATEAARRGTSREESPRLEITFFDELRAPLGTKSLGPWYGTNAWRQHSAVFPVPAKARLAVLVVGMYGGVGQLSVDQITVHATGQRSGPTITP